MCQLKGCCLRVNVPKHCHQNIVAGCIIPYLNLWWCKPGLNHSKGSEGGAKMRLMFVLCQNCGLSVEPCFNLRQQ